jgi:microcystin-dependent protein
MTTVNLSSFAGAGSQFFDDSGVPLAGGLIYSYLAGTTTPLVSYTSSTGLTAHPNPIVLDSAGRINEVWIPEGTNSKFVLQTSTNVLIGTYDSLFPIASLPVSIYNGGTGATTAAGARANLGLGTFLVPTGSVIMWPSNTSPTNWKICNGDAISRVTFVDLFSLIGTTFGAGDGTTTFNLPDYRNRMPYGADTVAVGATGGSADATLVSHSHTGSTGLGNQGHVHAYSGTTGGQSVQHTHDMTTYIGVNGGGGGTGYVGNNSGGGTGPAELTSVNSVDHNHAYSGTTGDQSAGHIHGITAEGSSATNANMQPYVVVYMWTRTA